MVENAFIQVNGLLGRVVGVVGTSGKSYTRKELEGLSAHPDHPDRGALTCTNAGDLEKR